MRGTFSRVLLSLTTIINASFLLSLDFDLGSMESINQETPEKTNNHDTTGKANGDTSASRRVNKSTLALATASTALFVVTAWFAASTFSGESGEQAIHILQSHFKISFSSAVTILSLLNGLTSTLTAFAVGQSYEGIQWKLASRDRGLRLLSFLGLSPTTGILGAAKLVLGQEVQHSDRAWAASRIFSGVVLFVAGIVLFIKTSSVTAYNRTDTFRVIAGTGQFNGSFVEPFLESIGTVVPYWALASTYNFVTNPLFSIPSRPISCPESGSPCDSYIFPGGTYLMYPQPTTQPSADSTFIIYDAPGTQIDFAKGLEPSDQFLEQDCIVYGSDYSPVAVEFCLAMSEASAGSLVAGIFVCPNGMRAGSCALSKPGPVPNISTTMTVYNRQATTVCAAANNSILSVYDLGDPQMDLAINLTALHLAVGWLLNYTASGLPVESSLNFWLWFGSTGTYVSIWETNAYATLQSLLSFIIWEFCTNNNENPAVASEQTGGQPNLPVSFQTTASISQPYTRFVLNRATFITYLILESLALVLIWSVIIWQCTSRHHHPEISSYPLVDFASKLQEKVAVNSAHSLSLRGIVSPESGDKAIRRSLSKFKIIAARHDSDRSEPEPSYLVPNGPFDEANRRETMLATIGHSSDHPREFCRGSPTAGQERNPHSQIQTFSGDRAPHGQAPSSSHNIVMPDNQSIPEPDHDTSLLAAASTTIAVHPEARITAASKQSVLQR